MLRVDAERPGGGVPALVPAQRGARVPRSTPHCSASWPAHARVRPAACRATPRRLASLRPRLGSPRHNSWLSRAASDASVGQDGPPRHGSVRFGAARPPASATRSTLLSGSRQNYTRRYGVKWCMARGHGRRHDVLVTPREPRAPPAPPAASPGVRVRNELPRSIASDALLAPLGPGPPHALRVQERHGT